MSRQYKRVYDLTFEDVDGNVRVIREQRLTFEITKTLNGIPNQGRISIYNPNQDTLALMERKFTKVTLNAGYEGNSRLLFTGQIRNLVQLREGEDRIATIYSADGEQDWKNTTFNKTFTENVSMKKVIENIVASFSGLGAGDLSGIPDTTDKLRGTVLSGASKDLMDQFAKEYGFQWSIQDGDVVVVADNESVDQPDTAVLITSTTGMLGTPSVTEIGADVTTLLNPNLQPNRIFKIESVSSQLVLGNLFLRDVQRTSAEGFYKVQEVIHSGDTRGNSWTSVVKGVIYNV